VAKVGGQIWGEGEGRTKKEAEQQAAEAAWTAISARVSAAAEADGAEFAVGVDGVGQASPAPPEPARHESAHESAQPASARQSSSSQRRN
jgi:ribonuclease-3